MSEPEVNVACGVPIGSITITRLLCDEDIVDEVSWDGVADDLTTALGMLRLAEGTRISGAADDA